MNVKVYTDNGSEELACIIKRDIKTITKEADDTHKGELDSLYKRETLQPSKARV